ncbi:hypothetical protein [Nocardioides sp.]|uniref:hypothetical protein n=1 Tax=Nocardioides sp. TaxID=35761 RepID=UPI0027256BD0|nr:hypothetical protein [Nocardioides sp.]MDO9455930.1 hypothetical protein [Nocardioides sp.]
MGAEVQQWVQLGAQAAEAAVWFLLAVWCLERMRRDVWARLASVGAVLLLIPAVTVTAARTQLMVGDSFTILQNYSLSTLPTAYAVMRVVAAVLLIAAVVVGRGTARPSAA